MTQAEFNAAMAAWLAENGGVYNSAHTGLTIDGAVSAVGTVQTDLAAHKSDGNIHTTTQEKAGWSGKAGAIHATRHAANGADPITPAAIGAARIETISYAGTGLYGSSSPTTITANFEPKLLTIAAVGSNGTVMHQAEYSLVSFPIEAVPKTNSFIQVNVPASGTGFRTIYFRRSVDGKTISWYSTTAIYQLNASTLTYHCTLIG